MHKTIALADAPAPDLLIEYPNGTITALMFHFALEHHELRAIAREAGFDLAWEGLDDQGEEVIRDWQPPTPEGWQLAGKWDTEDGPTVYFIRKVEQANG